MLIVSNAIKLARLYDMPKSYRKEWVRSRDEALKTGCANYRSGRLFSVQKTDHKPSKRLMAGERMLAVSECAELANGESGRWWRFYLGIDYGTEPQQPRVDKDYLNNALLDPVLEPLKQKLAVIRVATPRRIYVASSAEPGYYQHACYEMNDVEAVASLLSKPKCIAVQTEKGREVVTTLLGKDGLLSLGSALLLEQGGLLEL